jgi:hypothetical protein
MPKATASGLPMHLWRINPDVNYRTFPTAEEFGVIGTPTKKIANASAETYSAGTYDNAVWVDVDYACGQCHGGSRGPNATRNGAPYFPKDGLAVVAKTMHMNADPSASVTASIKGYTVTLTDTSTDDRSFPPNAVTIQWGDKASDKGNAGSVFAHTYAKPNKYVITYTITDKDGAVSTKKITVVVQKATIQAKK